MNQIKPYFLPTEQPDQGCFYDDLSLFTDSVLHSFAGLTSNYIDEYISFLKVEGIENTRTHDEYLVEMLMLGIFWKNYSGNASKTGYLPYRILDFLYKQRRRFPAYKPLIDKVRGYLGYIFLGRGSRNLVQDYTAGQMKHLLNWLKATGEFTEEVNRLSQWILFCRTKNRHYTRMLLEDAVIFAGHFAEKGSLMLCRYVKDQKKFQQHHHATYKYREDYFFTGRHLNEYYLNMFAAEILNRSLKKGFTETRKKVLLLPTCMRHEPVTGCKAKSDGKELVCAACSADCNIGKVSSEMKKEGIISYLIPHSSDFSKFLVKWKDCPDTSLIGVACVLNLLSGGYEMKRLNISSQCVFLDYCGCKKHWDKDGYATSLDIDQLHKIVMKTNSLANEASIKAVVFN